MATVRFSRSMVGMGFTCANAWPMLPSVAVMESDVISSRMRENVCSGLTITSFSISSFGSTVSPVTFTSEILYCSPSEMPAVMNMSRLSGLIDTWVESMLKST